MIVTVRGRLRKHACGCTSGQWVRKKNAEIITRSGDLPPSAGNGVAGSLPLADFDYTQGSGGITTSS